MLNTTAVESRVCQCCLWWDTDSRRVTITAPCVLTTRVEKPRATCSQWTSHRGAHALDALVRRLAS